ncbi:MAG TPA: alpha-N-arabinofuranosidase [Tepidisphaeraceae bacterium]|nr:alpha-N-arabinofuranosidase [Tepidisphaeraceae bacterium]
MSCAVAMRAQSIEPISGELTLHADQLKGEISRNLYGQFAEHLGRCVYEGLWVGEDSTIPNTRGIRNDVVAALKNLNVPFIRWPGGCFADEYHWRDGIGPKNQRPKRINTHWGGVIETNAFGTHEFMDLCEQIGASPYISGNVGTGTPQEMMEWVEYMTSASDSTLANERRKNGHPEPWKIPYFGVGNESWGCGGNMTPEYYSDEFRKFGTFVKNYSANRITKIASGPNGDDFNWTEVLMSHVGRQMNAMSLHWYTLPTGNWSNKGSSTQFDESQWHATLVQAMRMEELLQKHSAIMDKYDSQKRIGLAVDEWGTWYNPEPGSTPGFLYQQNSLRDAIIAGISLNLFNQHCDRVRMAAIAQMVNVLQAMILTDKEKMLLTPTYYVFEMYKVHQGARLIPIDLTAPEYKMGSASVPSVNASASRDMAGKVHLSIVNLDANNSAKLSVKLAGVTARQVTGRILTAPAMNAINTFDNPTNVKPADFTGFEVKGEAMNLSLPAKSVVMLEIQ